MIDELEPLTPQEGLELYLDDMQTQYAGATLYSKRSGLAISCGGAKKRKAVTISTS